MSSWFVARIHVDSNTELDKLYFFIAVSVIDPAAAPARKSNAQISFSQIDPFSLQPIHPTRPISNPVLQHQSLLLSHSLYLSRSKRLSGIFLARVILSTPFRSIAIAFSSEKLPTPKVNPNRESPVEYRRRYYCTECLEFSWMLRLINQFLIIRDRIEIPKFQKFLIIHDKERINFLDRNWIHYF